MGPGEDRRGQVTGWGSLSLPRCLAKGVRAAGIQPVPHLSTLVTLLPPGVRKGPCSKVGQAPCSVLGLTRRVPPPAKGTVKAAVALGSGQPWG